MGIVVALDVHRRQITYKTLDRETGEVSRGRVDHPQSDGTPTEQTCAHIWISLTDCSTRKIAPRRFIAGAGFEPATSGL